MKYCVFTVLPCAARALPLVNCALPCEIAKYHLNYTLYFQLPHNCRISSACTCKLRISAASLPHRSRVLTVRYRVLTVRCRVLTVRYRVLAVRYCVLTV